MTEHDEVQSQSNEADTIDRPAPAAESAAEPTAALAEVLESVIGGVRSKLTEQLDELSSSFSERMNEVLGDEQQRRDELAATLDSEKRRFDQERQDFQAEMRRFADESADLKQRLERVTQESEQARSELQRANEEQKQQILALAENQAATAEEQAIEEGEAESDATAREAGRLRQAIARLDEAPTQAEILSRLLEEATSFASRAALLIGPDELSGDDDRLKLWNGIGFGESLAGQAVAPPQTWAAALSGDATLLLEGSRGDNLASILSDSEPQQALVIPFILRDSTRALLYCDDGGHDDLADDESLQILCFSAAQALETLPLRSLRPSATLGLPLRTAEHESTESTEPELDDESGGGEAATLAAGGAAAATAAAVAWSDSEALDETVSEPAVDVPPAPAQDEASAESSEESLDASAPTDSYELEEIEEPLEQEEQEAQEARDAEGEDESASDDDVDVQAAVAEEPTEEPEAEAPEQEADDSQDAGLIEATPAETSVTPPPTDSGRGWGQPVGDVEPDMTSDGPDDADHDETKGAAAAAPLAAEPLAAEPSGGEATGPTEPENPTAPQSLDPNRTVSFPTFDAQNWKPTPPPGAAADETPAESPDEPSAAGEASSETRSIGFQFEDKADSAEAATPSDPPVAEPDVLEPPAVFSSEPPTLVPDPDEGKDQEPVAAEPEPPDVDPLWSSVSSPEPAPLGAGDIEPESPPGHVFDSLTPTADPALASPFDELTQAARDTDSALEPPPPTGFDTTPQTPPEAAPETVPPKVPSPAETIAAPTPAAQSLETVEAPGPVIETPTLTPVGADQPPKPEKRGSSEVMPPDDLDGPGWAFTGSSGAAEEDPLHEEAKRLARLLVSEIKLYNEEQIEAGKAQGNIYLQLREDIDRSRKMYDERVDPSVRSSSDYFRDELIKNLADGNAAVLGL